MIKGLNGKSGRDDRLISFVDLAPTVLEMTHVEVPEHIQGKSFLSNEADVRREYIFASSDRFDEFTDRSRAVRDERYLYIQQTFQRKSGTKT
jgi:hypothetical protein